MKNELIMDREQIQEVLPHRDPFLFVDGVLEMTENRIVAVKNVSKNEPYFQGHFPGKPVMPGVLMIESLAQAGGILMLSKSENKGKIAYLVAVNNARFRKMVLPGDRLLLEATITKLKSKVGLVECVATVDGEEVCSTEIMFTLA